MKKLMSILLALAMVVTSNVSFAAAANNGPSDSQWEYDGYYIAFINIFEDNEIWGEDDDFFSIFSNNTVHNDAIAGAAYDLASNTLTLKDFKHPNYGISANMMGMILS